MNFLDAAVLGRNTGHDGAAVVDEAFKIDDFDFKVFELEDVGIAFAFSDAETEDDTDFFRSPFGRIGGSGDGQVGIAPAVIVVVIVIVVIIAVAEFRGIEGSGVDESADDFDLGAVVVFVLIRESLGSSNPCAGRG